MLISKCASQIKTAIQRQMSKIDFFNTDTPTDKYGNIDSAPITNLGPESNFGSVDEDLKRSGNSTKLTTISEKHIIEKNKLHLTDQWKDMPDDEKQEQWRWARSSDEVKEVKEKEKELQLFLESVNQLATEKKKEDKRKLTQKLNTALTNCKKYGGPITSNDVEKLDSLTLEQVNCEVAYLKLTIGQNIRYKRKVDGKMIPFSIEELRSQIRDVLKPESSDVTNMDSALIKALMQ